MAEESSRLGTKKRRELVHREEEGKWMITTHEGCKVQYSVAPLALSLFPEPPPHTLAEPSSHARWS